MERLFVGGLSSNISSEDVKLRLKSFGQVQNCEIITKGKIIDVENTFAYVDIIPNENNSVSNLIALFNNSLWKGQKLRVERAKTSFFKIVQAEQQLYELSQQISLNESIIKISNEPKLAEDLCMNVKVRNNLFKIDRLGCGNIRRYFRSVKTIPLDELVWEIPEVKRKRQDTHELAQFWKKQKQQDLVQPTQEDANVVDNQTNLQTPQFKNLQINKFEHLHANGIKKRNQKNPKQFQNSTRKFQKDDADIRFHSEGHEIYNTNRVQMKKMYTKPKITEDQELSYTKFSDYKTDYELIKPTTNKYSSAKQQKFSKNQKFITKLQEREGVLNKKQLQKQLLLVDNLSKGASQHVKTKSPVLPEKGVVEFDDVEEKQVQNVQNNKIVNFWSDSEEEFQDLNEKQIGPPPQDLINWKSRKSFCFESVED
eukprot:TRINITY_DN7752_c0_g1_i1.p1 TRINITY_DN7752_c0_g1~~TRINITY_DN7752_c0_g1_i1.p1  ORF type:complete len:425 (+),score=36.09 TRINITY_DN7752_c0_g1_i1:207-1481(+)